MSSDDVKTLAVEMGQHVFDCIGRSGDPNGMALPAVVGDVVNINIG